MKLVSYTQFEKILLELFSTIDDVYDRNNYQFDYSYNNIVPVIKEHFRDYFPYHQNIKNLSLRLYKYSTEYYNTRYLDKSSVIDNYRVSYNCCLHLFNEYLPRMILNLMSDASISDLKYINKNIRNCKASQGYLNILSLNSLINKVFININLFSVDDYIFIEEVIRILRIKKCESRYLPMIITTT